MSFSEAAQTMTEEKASQRELFRSFQYSLAAWPEVMCRMIDAGLNLERMWRTQIQILTLSHSVGFRRKAEA